MAVGMSNSNSHDILWAVRGYGLGTGWRSVANVTSAFRVRSWAAWPGPICHDDKSLLPDPARLILLEINVPFRTLHLPTSLLTRVSHRNNVANRHAK